MERLRIVINFKNTPEDIELYNKLKRHSCMSAYIKDYLRGLFDDEVKEEETKKVKNSDVFEGIDDILS